MDSDPLSRVAKLFEADSETPPKVRAAARHVLEAREELSARLRELGTAEMIQLATAAAERQRKNQAWIEEFLIQLELLALEDQASPNGEKADA
jgi:hypothetical protein